MDITFHNTNFKADKKLLELISSKLNKLAHFYDKIIDATVYLKVENTEGKENKFIEIKMNVANQTLFVEEHDRTFENALDSAEDALKAQLIKYKQKQAQANA